MFRGFPRLYKVFMHSIDLPICSKMHITNFHCTYLSLGKSGEQEKVQDSRSKMIVHDSTYVEMDLKLTEEDKTALSWFPFERG